MATGVYKTVHGHEVPKGIGELLRSTNYNIRGEYILELPQVKTTSYLRFMIYKKT